GTAVAAEPLAGLVQRPAGGADLTEPAAAVRTVAALRAVTLTAGRTGDFRLRVHDSFPPARAARASRPNAAVCQTADELLRDHPVAKPSRRGHDLLGRRLTGRVSALAAKHPCQKANRHRR